jgi:hypothetical protein
MGPIAQNVGDDNDYSRTSGEVLTEWSLAASNTTAGLLLVDCAELSHALRVDSMLLV